MSDELDAIAADDRVVERLRAALSPDAAVVWGDDDEDTDDAGAALLRALQQDVAVAPERLAEVLPLHRRRLRRGVAVAAVAAGVLSFAGVAAAAPGAPLAGVRSAVASAVSQVVAALTPGRTGEPVAVPGPATPTATLTPPGQSVSDAARAAAARQQVERLLARAGDLVAAGHVSAARAVLATAARTVDLLDAEQRDAYRAQIKALYAACDQVVSQREEQARSHQPPAHPGPPGQGPSTRGTSAPGAGSAPSGRTSSAGRTEPHPSQHDAAVQPLSAAHRG